MNKASTQTEIKASGSNLVEEIIRMSDYSFERLPMLDIIGERVAESIALTLPDLTGSICEASFDNLDYLPMAQVLTALPEPALLAVLETQTLEGGILVAMDSTMVLTALELALGGSAKGGIDQNPEGFTTIEQNFGKKLARICALELQRALSLVGGIDVELDRIETDPEAAAVTQPANLCTRMRFTIVLAGSTGTMEIIIPYDGLEPIRPKLSKVHFGEPAEGDSPWRDQLSGQIERATVELEAILVDIKLPIQEVMNWKNGSTLNLWIQEEHEATVISAGTAMFKATMGKRNNGNTAVRITETLTEEGETENDRNDS